MASSIPVWYRNVFLGTKFFASLSIAIALVACGGGGAPTDVGGIATPQITSSPQSLTRIVGQEARFDVVADSSVTSFSWEDRVAGAGWIPTPERFISSGSTSQLSIASVTIGHHEMQYRAIAQNAAGGTPSAEAVLSVFWGAVETLEPNSFDFGPGSEGFGSADGGSPGGGDGEGAGAGGGLGKTVRASISVTRTVDGVSLGTALTGATSGLVRIKAGPGTAPALLSMTGAEGASYYDEGRDLMMPLPSGETLHALITDFDQHVGVTILSEAVYRYALNHFIVDPEAVRDGSTPLRRSATAEEIARLTPAQIQLAQEAVRAEINRILPARHRLDFITTLPTPVDTTSGRGAITNNRYGRMQVVIGGLALAAGRFNAALEVPALTMTAQLADDLTDGVIDGLALDQRTVFGAPGAAYGPDNLPFALEAAADEQLARYGDGSADVPPAITAQPVSTTITEGGSATLGVTASGTGLSYQWRRDSVDIPGATQATHLTREAGSYSVVISNSAASVTSNVAVVNVVPAVVAPSIITQPVSTTVTTGSIATFAVVAAGTNLDYQWHNTAGEIRGATAPSYSTGNAGTYHVVVSNSAGSVTSAGATLVLTPRIDPPAITSQPVSTTVNAGGVASMAVVATGGELQYQWHNAQGPIPNATAPSHTTTSSGSYFVVVRNTAGTVTSVTITVTVVAPPAIVTQPASATITEGSTHTFGVVASGSGLSYQWHNAQGPIANADAASYTTAAAGSYHVVIRNPAGSIASAIVALTLTPRVDAARITSHPASVTINEGSAATLSVTATGTSLAYQWHNGSGAVAGANAATYTTRSAGTYFVVVSNSAGSTTSNTAVVTVVTPPVINSQPASATITEGGTHTFSVVATGSSLSYQWRNAQGPIPGATASSHVTGTAGTYSVLVSNGAGSVSSASATLTVTAREVAPAITSHPAPVTIQAGGSATLRVVATGTSLTYQWQDAATGAAIANATGTSYTTATAGTYRVVVRNSLGSVTSNPATVTVITPPVITSQPASATITEGSTHTFSVVATGSQLSYQWRNAQGPIPGATASSHVTGTAGTYSVLVSNGAGGVPSASATLTVTAREVAPAITSHPVPVTIQAGGSATLRVVATGTSLTYQWQDAATGAAIANATGTSYTTATAGTYRVVVRNSLGSVTSNPATVTVITPPVITSQPESASLPIGSRHTMSVKASGIDLHYQWFTIVDKAPQAIKGADSASYTTDVTGTYYVEVRNAAGSVDSNLAEVRFTGGAPVIVEIVQKCGPSACDWFVDVTGIAPITYQWYVLFPGGREPLGGATSPTFTASKPGSYVVDIRNPAGSITSPVLAFPPPKT